MGADEFACLAAEGSSRRGTRQRNSGLLGKLEIVFGDLGVICVRELNASCLETRERGGKSEQEALATQLLGVLAQPADV